MAIKGITIILYEKFEAGKDDFGKSIYEEVPVEVENVLVSPTSLTDVIDQLNLHGKKAIYTLAIPKNDSHDWKDVKVEFFGEIWKTFGFPTEGIAELIPLEWNKKVMVERYG